MKNVMLLLLATLSFSMLNAQADGPVPPVWSGSGLTGDAWRTGHVGIDVSSPEAMLTIGNSYSNGGFLMKVGDVVTTGRRHFNIGLDSDESIDWSVYDTDGGLRLSFSAEVASESNTTWLELWDANTVNYFKAARVPSGAYVHLPLANSKMVIGEYATYSGAQDYMLYVRTGSAKVEGDIITDGNIGIGTDSFQDGNDSYRLSIDGKMRAEAIKVYTTWADYVFEQGYQLPTLKEVEAFIDENGHLQDIPSAAEVESNGIDVGEINKLLLQKIEELTLYMIEKDKQVESLNKKNTELENSLEELKKAVGQIQLNQKK